MVALTQENITNNQITTGEIVTPEGNLVFPEQYEIAQEMIENAQAWGIKEVEITQFKTEDKDLLNKIMSEQGEILLNAKHLIDYKNVYSKSLEAYLAQKTLFLDFFKSNFHNDLELSLFDLDIFEAICRNILGQLGENIPILLAVLLNDQDYELSDAVGFHCLRTIYFSVIVGHGLHLPNHQLVDLAFAAGLHEIGMRRIPAQIYEKEGKLSEKELQLIKFHCKLGSDDLKKNNLKLEIVDAVLEHHEREDGSGYPRQLKSKDIGLYGKILAFTCSFEAQTSKRSYKESKTSYASLVELLQTTNAYDVQILKSFLDVISLIPIGSYVLLTNGCVGKVIDTVSGSPKEVIVQILYSDQKQYVTETIVLKTPLEGPYSLKKVLEK